MNKPINEPHSQAECSTQICFCGAAAVNDTFVDDFERAAIENMSGDDWVTGFWTRACALLVTTRALDAAKTREGK
jgi:hypothetical protein